MLVSFGFAVAILLLTPGPTNTLLAVAGSTAGVRNSMPLIAAEFLGYFTGITLLAGLAGPYLVSHPALAMGIKLCSAAWVLWLSTRLWVQPVAVGDGSLVTFRKVYVTTLLNPKGLIIALTLLPPAPLQDNLAYLLLLAAAIVVIASLWLMLGHSVIRKINGHHPALIGRLASACLLFFAANLTGKAMGWM